MRSHSILLEFSNRLFRKFLKVYPRQHHDRFNEEMAQDFRELCEEVLHERGLWGFLRLWTSVGLDLIKTAIEEQLKVRTNPSLEKLVRIGGVSAVLAGATSFLLAFTHASPNWLDWVFRLKWIWFFLGGINLLALLGFAASQVLLEKTIGIGLWISLVGAAFMSVTGIFMPVDIQIWRFFSYGIDLLAAGLLVQSAAGLTAGTSLKWTSILFSLGVLVLTFNQLTPPRHLGLLFEWDGAFFAASMGAAWTVFGMVLLREEEQRKQVFQ